MLELGERALICSGPNDFAPVSDLEHVKIVRAIDHAAIFPMCRAVVHHGGAGTTAAALRAGTPMLILWLWLDQPVWATGITELKVGARTTICGRYKAVAGRRPTLDSHTAIRRPRR